MISMAVGLPVCAPSPDGERVIPKTKAAAKPTVEVPDGGNGLVWVNTASKICHCSGAADYGKTAADYGKTKEGGYMSEAVAKAAGNRAARNKACP